MSLLRYITLPSSLLHQLEGITSLALLLFKSAVLPAKISLATSDGKNISEQGPRSSHITTITTAGDKQIYDERQKERADLEYKIYLQNATQARACIRKVRMDMHKFVLRPNFDSDDVFEDLCAFGGDLVLRKRDKNTSRPPAKLEPVTPMPEPTIDLVDGLDKVASMVDHIINLQDPKVSAPLLYVDCEGVNLGRNGTVTLMPCYVPLANVVYVVDIQELGAGAFTTPGTGTHLTFKDILEGNTVKKALFDCRCDSDALFFHYNVRLGGVTDVQLMDLATRRNETRVAGLKSCMGRRLNLPEDVKEECQMIQRWGGYAFKQGVEVADQLLEDDKRVMIATNKWPSDRCVLDVMTDKVARGEAMAAVNIRPIPQMMEKYIVNDVVLLPALYQHYVAHQFFTEEWLGGSENSHSPALQNCLGGCDYFRCPREWMHRVEEETERRLSLSRSPDFVGNEVAMNAVPQEWDKFLNSPKTG
ncbi:hypothetical protein LTR08_006890 [Meristemomyces frigidus]|nr:hypothetical protein LTR08_006890 [Meristemomyces frigidus]